MAMVFLSERNLDLASKDEQNYLGPGEYNPLSLSKKITRNKEPFLASSPRTKIEIKDTPGPGSYYHDETYINYLKNLNNEKVSKQNDRTYLLAKKVNGELSKISLLFNTEKRGFNIKSKRFKIINNNDDVPGPGQYFKEKKKRKIKSLKDNENNINKKIKIMKINELQKIPTIPSKKNFGFEILNNGELIQRQNPNLYKTFTGEKGDTVGPGTYEIENPNNWLKTGTTWSKLRSVRNCNKNDFSTSVSTTNYSERKINNNNLTNNFINGVTGRNSKILIKTKSFELNENLNINKKSLFNLAVDNCKNNNKKKCKTVKTFESIIKKATPGPGYYYDEKGLSSFKVKYVPELRQYFGSKLSRFFIKNNNLNSLGPGEYFKTEKKPTNMNKTSSVAFAPFSSSVERFNNLEGKNKNPGPCDYNPSDLITIKKNSKSSESKFGSKESRFNNMYNINWKNSVPGPGFYDTKKDIDLISNKKNTNKNKKGNIYNSSKIDLIKLNTMKINNLTNNELKEEDIPPIGLYNPGIVNSIDYKIKKKVYETRNNNVAFTTTYNKKNKNKNNIVINCEESNLGPGYYYRDYKKKDNKLSSVFHLPEFRRNSNTKIQGTVGPGEYNLNSYNDWTKKSFNIHFV